MSYKPETHTQEVQEIAKAAIYLRGAIITAYAHVEYLLADICVKAWQRPGYAEFKKRFPYKARSRVSSAMEVFSIEGRLNKYQTEAQPLLEPMLAFEETRDFIAHGLMRVFREDKTDRIEFCLYKPVADKELLRGTFSTNIAELGQTADDMTDYSDRVVKLWHKIYTQEGLP